MSGPYNRLQESNQANTTQASAQYLSLVESNGQMVYKNDTYYSVSSKKVVVNVPPSTQVPANLSSSQVDIRVDQGAGLDIIDYCTLQYTLTNTTGGPINVIAPNFILQRVDYTNNGSSILYSTYQQELFYQNTFLDRNTYEAMAGAMNLSNSYVDLGLTVPLANGETKTYNLPLLGFWKAAKFALSGINQPLLLRFYFNPQSMIFSGGVPTTTNLSLIITGRQLKSQQKRELNELWNNGRIPMSLSHTSVDRMSQTLLLAPSSTYKIILTGLAGVCSFMMNSIRLASTYNTQAAQGLYENVESFDVLDSSGSSLIGYFPRNHTTQQIQWAQLMANNAYNDLGFNFISFGSDPQATFANGDNGGYAVITGQEQYQFTTLSTLVAGSYVVDIRGYMMENVIYDKGVLRATRV
jgi:hypothetical protein